MSTHPKKQAICVVTAVCVADESSLLHTIRLDRSLPHFPTPVVQDNNGKCCAVCRWATGNKYKAQLSYCDDCNTTLCVWCYKTYHTEVHLDSRREELGDKIIARKVAKSKNKITSGDPLICEE